MIDYNKIFNYLPNFSIIGDSVDLVVESEFNLKNVHYEIFNPNVVRRLNYDGLVDSTNKIHLKEIIGDNLNVILSSDFLLHEEVIDLNNNTIVTIDINDDDLIKSNVKFLYNTRNYFKYKLINTEFNIEYKLDNKTSEYDILYGTYRLEIGINDYVYTFKKSDYINIYKPDITLKLPVIKVNNIKT